MKKIFHYVIRAYQTMVSPFTVSSCRYTPTCSGYIKQAINKFGIMRGGWLGVCRLLSCHPWGGCGHDPVPENFSWYPRRASVKKADHITDTQYNVIKDR